MRVTEPRPANTSNSHRRIPCSVRLSPEVVNELCSHPVAEEARADNREGAAGLLFGTAEQEVVCVEAFKAFPATDSTGNGAAKRQCLDTAFESFIAGAKRDPQLTSLHIVGWYRIRGRADTTRLFDTDIEFHNHLFRRATDVALIFNPKKDAFVSIQLYSRSSLNAAISRQHYRSGSLLLNSATRVTAPIDVTVRETIDDDSYLKVFQVLESLDRTERRERWKRIALRLKTLKVLSIRPAWMKPRVVPEVHNPAPGSSDLSPKATTRIGRLTSHEGNSPLSGSRSAQTKLGWMLSAVLFVLAMGVALAWLYLPLISALPGNPFFPKASTLAKPVPVREEKAGSRQFDTTSMPSQSGTTDSKVMRRAPRKLLEPEPKVQTAQKSAAIDSAEFSAGERRFKRTDSNSSKPELRKAVQPLPSTEPPASSLRSAAINNSLSTQYVPARPLKQVMPSANNLEASGLSEATDVEVQVRVDEGGRVTEARVVNDNSNIDGLLATAAIAAAKEWIFEPAKMDGRSVPGNHMIRFHFTPKIEQP